MAVAAVAGAAAAAAYLDGRYQLRRDATDIFRAKQAMREVEGQAKTGRLSLWYRFEEQVKRWPSTMECIWSRAGCYNWQETHANACRYAQLLLSHGVQPGETVAFYLVNSPEFMFSYLATWAIGTAPALINYNLAGDALIHCLKIGGSRVVLVDEDAECRGRIEESRSRIENELGMKIVILDQSTRDALSKTEPRRPERRYREKVNLMSPVMLMYTSGTTGLPKAVAFRYASTWTIVSYRKHSNAVRPGPGGDRYYDCMPLYHGTGNTVAVGAMCVGMTLCIGKKFSVSRFWEDVRDSDATFFVYVGETARYLLNAPPSPRDKDHKIRIAYGNGLRPDVWEKFRERFGIPIISEFFNSSEGVFALANVNHGPYTAASVGHFGLIKRWTYRDWYVPVAIDHETGDIWRDPKTGFARRVPYEEGGEMLVMVPSEQAFSGYWNNSEATSKKFLRNVFKKGDLAYRSGDALRRTQDGHWYFMDRLGDTFRWKGENVSTAEVAECLGKFPGVQEANVYGVELPGHDGRAGCAAVHIDPSQRASFDYQGLLDYSRKTLPKYAVPIFIRVIHEQTMGHNNKQVKVPYKKEGVDVKKIAEGDVGPQDKILWLAPKSNSYASFGEQEWESLVAGSARL